ncbi:MAG: shikimate kinase [Bacteroidetes bacterium]|nr:shikimate kinase [Bacteroidota bacterium]
MSASENKHIPKCISFIGFMGSGKSTIGKEISQILNYEFIDIDEKLKIQEGLSIAEIFKLFGESYFRKNESTYLKKVIEKTNVVISCGGGIVTNVHNCDLLKQKSYVIWLRNSIETTIVRCKNSSRPLLNVENPLDEAKKIYNQREAFYQNTAHLVIDTDDKSPMDVVKEIISNINSTSIT